MKNISEWKKVVESDLSYIADEIKETINTPAIIFLEGNLGAGKTTFARYFCQGKTLSPTYSIINESEDILHADFYRIENPDEFLYMDLSQYLDGKNYFLAEWGIKYCSYLMEILPDNFDYYRLQIISGDLGKTRDLKLDSFDPLLL